VPNRVRIRRERPSALSWALALAVTMLAVYLITLSAPAQQEKTEKPSQTERVTTEITFDAYSVYFADLGCHEDAAQARLCAALLAERGAAGRLYSDAQGVHVLGAAYENESDAARIAAQLGESEGLAAGVLHLSAGEVRLRVTAPEADAQAIAGGYRILREQLAQAASLASQVDRGELTGTAARMLASVSKSEVRAALERLELVEGAAGNPVCTGLAAVLRGLADSFDLAARETDSSPALSGRLRFCHVDGSLALIGYLTGLYD